MTNHRRSENEYPLQNQCQDIKHQNYDSFAMFKHISREKQSHCLLLLFTSTNSFKLCVTVLGDFFIFFFFIKHQIISKDRMGTSE